MVPRKSGKIVNIGSLMSQFARPTVAPYTVAKGGIKLLTQMMAAEWAEQNRTYSALWPNITRKGEPPADADEWKDKPDKAKLFSPEPGKP